MRLSDELPNEVSDDDDNSCPLLLLLLLLLLLCSGFGRYESARHAEPPPAVRPGAGSPALFRHHTKGPTQHTLSSDYRKGNVCVREACRGHATLSYFWLCE